MNKLAKVLSVVLSVAMVASVCVVMIVSAFAAGKPTFSLNVVSEEGKTVVVSVKLDSGKFQNGTFKVNFGSNIESCTKIAKGTTFKGLCDEIEENSGIVTFAPNTATAMAAVASTVELDKAGDYFVFTLTKKSDANVSKADISLVVSDIEADVVNNLPAAAETTTAAPETTTAAPETTTAAPAEDETTTAAPVEDETTTAAPVEDETTTAAPVEDETTTAAPVEDETTTAAPAEDETTTAAEVVTTASQDTPVDPTTVVSNPSTGDAATASAGIVAVLAISAAAVVALRKKED